MITLVRGHEVTPYIPLPPTPHYPIAVIEPNKNLPFIETWINFTRHPARTPKIFNLKVIYLNEYLSQFDKLFLKGTNMTNKSSIPHNSRLPRRRKRTTLRCWLWRLKKAKHIVFPTLSILCTAHTLITPRRQIAQTFRRKHFFSLIYATRRTGSLIQLPSWWSRSLKN